MLRFLDSYFDRSPVGGVLIESDCRINDETIRKPDVSVFLGQRWEDLDMNRTPVPFAPGIAVEVLSPSERSAGVTRKVHDYLSAGGQEVWLLDHENGELQVRTDSGIRLLKASGVLDTPLLPGFAVKVADLLSGR